MGADSVERWRPMRRANIKRTFIDSVPVGKNTVIRSQEFADTRSGMLICVLRFLWSQWMGLSQDCRSGAIFDPFLLSPSLLDLFLSLCTKLSALSSCTSVSACARTTDSSGVKSATRMRTVLSCPPSPLSIERGMQQTKKMQR